MPEEACKENITIPSKSRWPLITLLLLILILEKIHILFWIAGYFGLASKWMLFALIQLLSLIFILGCSLIHVFGKKNKVDRLTKTILVCIMVGVFLPVTMHPYGVDYLRGFEYKIAKQIPVEEIQNWLAIFPKDASQQETIFNRGQYPDIFAQLNPDTVRIESLDGECNPPMVVLTWKSYMVGWGISVCAEAAKPDYHDYNSSITPEVWVWLDEYK